jgi:hypothetical protein
MNEELTPPEGPRRGRRPSEIMKRDKLNALISKVREKKAQVDKQSKDQ